MYVFKLARSVLLLLLLKENMVNVKNLNESAITLTEMIHANKNNLLLQVGSLVLETSSEKCNSLSIHDRESKRSID